MTFDRGRVATAVGGLAKRARRHGERAASFLTKIPGLDQRAAQRPLRVRGLLVSKDFKLQLMSCEDVSTHTSSRSASWSSGSTCPSTSRSTSCGSCSSACSRPSTRWTCRSARARPRPAAGARGPRRRRARVEGRGRGSGRRRPVGGGDQGSDGAVQEGRGPRQGAGAAGVGRRLDPRVRRRDRDVGREASAPDARLGERPLADMVADSIVAMCCSRRARRRAEDRDGRGEGRPGRPATDGRRRGRRRRRRRRGV